MEDPPVELISSTPKVIRQTKASLMAAEARAARTDSIKKGLGASTRQAILSVSATDRSANKPVEKTPTQTSRLLAPTAASAKSGIQKPEQNFLRKSNSSSLPSSAGSSRANTLTSESSSRLFAPTTAMRNAQSVKKDVLGTARTSSTSSSTLNKIQAVSPKESAAGEGIQKPAASAVSGRLYTASAASTSNRSVVAKKEVKAALPSTAKGSFGAKSPFGGGGGGSSSLGDCSGSMRSTVSRGGKAPASEPLVPKRERSSTMKSGDARSRSNSVRSTVSVSELKLSKAVDINIKGIKDTTISYLILINTAFKLTINSLSSYLGDSNIRDFAFIYEELQKSVSIASDISHAVIFPAFDKVSNNAVTAAKMTSLIEKEQSAAVDVFLELKERRSLAAAIFENWKRFESWKLAFLARLEKEEKLLLSLETKLGKSADARLLAYYTTVICPCFTRHKTEFTWLVGWTALVYSEHHVDVSALGLFVKNLRALTSPPQYTLLQDKVKANVEASLWSKLVSDYSVTQPGRQEESHDEVELPIKEEPRFARYFKMLKIGLPLETAAGKMSSDQAVDSYEEAVAVLSLDPNKPMPRRYRENAAAVAEPLTGVPVKSYGTLDFLRVVNASLRVVVAQLRGFISANNMKDLGFAREELEKTSSVLFEIKTRILFPALDNISGGLLASTRLAEKYASERTAFAAVTAEVQTQKKVASTTFEAWAGVFLACLDKEEETVYPLESKLGSSAGECAKFMAKHVISPIFVQNKTDFLWCVGWTATVVSDAGIQGTPPIQSLGQFVRCLQLLCSPSQFVLLTPRIKKNISSEYWSKLVKEYEVDFPGKQPEPEFQKPPIKDDVRFQKFFKMLKIGLPVDAAAQQMVREQAFGITDYDIAVAVLSSDPNSPFDENMI